MNNVVALNELNQFQQSEDLRRESFVKQICKIEEYIFARNTSIANKLSEYKDSKPNKIPNFNSAENGHAINEANRLMHYQSDVFFFKTKKRNDEEAKETIYTREMYEKEYGESIKTEKIRRQNAEFVNSGIQMMKIYKTLINYDVKRTKLFERAKKIGMSSTEWSRFNEYLNTIEQKILTNLQFDDFYLLINDIERLFGMIVGLLSDKLSHCMARPIRIINNLIDSGKNLINKVISAIKPEEKLENKPLTIDEWRKLEEAMALKHKNAVYLEKKLSDAKRIGEKNPSKIRSMIVDLMIKEKPNVLSS